MRLRREPRLLPTLVFLLPATLPLSSGLLNCKDTIIDGKHYTFSALDGPHSVTWSRQHPPSIVNTTFTIDICKPLRRTKGVPKGDECRSGTRGSFYFFPRGSDGAVPDVTGAS